MSRFLPPRSFHEFKDRVRVLAHLHRASETSGMRTAARNAAVGGSPRSKHLPEWGGLAVDLVPDNNTHQTRSDLVADAQDLGLWASDEGDHVHIQGLPPSPVQED